MNVRRLTGAVLLALVATLVLVLVLTGCNGGSPGPVNPTYGGPNGECVEADGELCDDDPFDLDDLLESKRSAKPTPVTKKSPAPKTSFRARR